MRALAPIVLSTLAIYSTGCAELRSEYMPSNGEPVSVYDHTVLRTGTQQVATGQDEVRDAQGNVIATNTHYQNQAVSWTERQWYPEQGGQRVDDESFFRIVDDKQNVERYQRFHEGGKKKNTIGFVLLGVGAALLGGGFGMYEADSPRVNDDGTTSGGGAVYTMGYVGMTAGLISAAVGTYMVLAGKKEAATQDARLIDEPDRFKFDAKRYNSALEGHSEVALSSAAAPAPPPVVAAPPRKSLSPATSSADEIAERLTSGGWTIPIARTNPGKRSITVIAVKGAARVIVNVLTSAKGALTKKSGHGVSAEEGGFVFDVRCLNGKEWQEEVLGLLGGR